MEFKEKKNIKSSELFKLMNMVYGFQAFTLLAFSLVTYYLNTQLPEKDFDNAAHYALSIGAIFSLAMAHYIPRYMLKNIKPELDLKYRVPKYFPVTIIRAACLEAAGFIACIAAFITGQNLYLAMVPLLLLVLYFFRPTPSFIATELNLNPKEREMIENPETVFVQQWKSSE